MTALEHIAAAERHMAEARRLLESGDFYDAQARRLSTKMLPEEWEWRQLERSRREDRRELFKPRCSECGYEHGHQIGCKHNPVDVALRR